MPAGDRRAKLKEIERSLSEIPPPSPRNYNQVTTTWKQFPGDDYAAAAVSGMPIPAVTPRTHTDSVALATGSEASNTLNRIRETHAGALGANLSLAEYLKNMEAKLSNMRGELQGFSNAVTQEKESILQSWEKDHAQLDLARHQEAEQAARLQANIAALEAQQHELLHRERIIGQELNASQMGNEAAWAAAAQVTHDATLWSHYRTSPPPSLSPRYMPGSPLYAAGPPSYGAVAPHHNTGTWKDYLPMTHAAITHCGGPYPHHTHGAPMARMAPTAPAGYAQSAGYAGVARDWGGLDSEISYLRSEASSLADREAQLEAQIAAITANKPL